MATIQRIRILRPSDRLTRPVSYDAIEELAKIEGPVTLAHIGGSLLKMEKDRDVELGSEE
jgi:hypothetical protein